MAQSTLADESTTERQHRPRILQAMARVMASPRALRAALAALVVFAMTLLYGLDQREVSVSLRLASTTQGQGEVFYAGKDGGYSQWMSVPFALVGDGKLHTYVLILPPSLRIGRIRVDPGTGSGTVEVEAIEIRSGQRTWKSRGTVLQGALGVTHDLLRKPTTENLSFLSEGGDPYFEIKLAKAIGGFTWSARLLFLALACASTFSAWLLLESVFNLIMRHILRSRHNFPSLGRISRFASDEHLLVVDRKLLLPFLALGLLAVFYVALDLNQSSLSLWENMYPASPAHQMIDLGTPKRIRSDEWVVQAPWVLNQIKAGSPLHNSNVGAENSPLIASLPVAGVVGLPHLKFAGFRLFGIERGVSWWWAYKSFALLASFLWLFLLLTRGNLPASLLGTAWIYTSSFVQWWFSSDLPEIMVAFAFGVTGMIYALFSGERRLILIGCALVAYAATNLLLNLYPPFIVPLGYLGVAVIAGHCIQNRGIANFRNRVGFRLAAIALAAILVGGYAIYFTSVASGSIDAMLRTAYPGRRISGSGGVQFAKVLYGYFESFRIGETNFPPMSTNASEASSFVLLFPLLLLAFPVKSLFRRGNALAIAISCACLLTASWVLFHLPMPIEKIFQALGWSLVTPKRAVLALGVGSILASILLFAKARRQCDCLYSPAVRYMSVVVVLVGTLAFGWGLRQLAPGFFSWQIVLGGTVACTLVSAGILTGRSALLAAGIAIYALPTITVNPLVSGISSISEKPILKLAERYSAAPSAKWAVIGDPTFAQGLKAHGLSVLGGTQFLPNPRDFSILDPTRRNESTWNRYATIGIKSNPALELPRFARKRGDQYWIVLNVCDGRLRSLGVDHLAYTDPVPERDLICLRELPTVRASGVRLFAFR